MTDNYIKYLCPLCSKTKIKRVKSCHSSNPSKPLSSSLPKNAAGTGMAASSHLSVSHYESSASLTVATRSGKHLWTWCRRPFHRDCWRCRTSWSCIQSWQMESHSIPSRAIVQKSPWPAHDGGNREWVPWIIQCSHRQSHLLLEWAIDANVKRLY